MTSGARLRPPQSSFSSTFNHQVVDSQSFFVDCEHPSLEAVAALDPPPPLTFARYLASLATGAELAAEGPAARTSFSAEARACCLEAPVIFEAYAPEGEWGGQRLMRYRQLEAETPFYENIFMAGSVHLYVLQATCCVWVTVQVYFVDLKNVCALLEFRDFNRWLLPLKGEQLTSNSWVLFIPALQLLLGTAVVATSCCITCGFTDAIDIVLNSLAFTFISKVAELCAPPEGPLEPAASSLDARP